MSRRVGGLTAAHPYNAITWRVRDRDRLAATRQSDDLSALIVVQPWGTVLGSKRGDGTDAGDRDERVVHVVVELVEGILQIRVLADLRTDRDHFARRRQHEVPMLRNRVVEHVWWISETSASERQHCDR